MATSNTIEVFKQLGLTTEAARLLAEVVEQEDSVVVAGDVTGNSATTTVEKIQGVEVSTTAPNNGEYLKYDSQALKWIPTVLPTIGRLYLGDGDDGDVTIGAGTTTLGRDMFYNNLVVPAGARLNTAGFAVFCKSSVSGAGIISANGAAGVFDAAGNNNAGTLDAGSGGGAGKATAGDNAVSTIKYIGGDAGNGGAGVALGGAKGSAGAVSGDVRQYKIPSILLNKQSNVAFNYYRVGGNAGGGGGGDNVAAKGGGGGAGGNTMAIFTSEFNFTGSLEAKGGAGGDGDTAAGATGGGGGGGGGFIALFYEVETTNPETIVIDVTGGAGGKGQNTGSDGGNGAVGAYILVKAI